MAESQQPDQASGEPNPPGVLGDGALQPGKYNMQLVRRAIRNDWPITDELRRMVINQMALVVGRGEDERNKIAAAKVLIAGDGINVKREQMDQKADYWQYREDAPVGDTTVNVSNITINTDDKRAGLAAIRERLGLGAILEGHAEGNGCLDSGSNGSSPEKHNGHANGKPGSDADAPDGPPS